MKTHHIILTVLLLYGLGYFSGYNRSTKEIPSPTLEECETHFLHWETIPPETTKVYYEVPPAPIAEEATIIAYTDSSQQVEPSQAELQPISQQRIYRGEKVFQAGTLYYNHFVKGRMDSSELIFQARPLPYVAVPDYQRKAGWYLTGGIQGNAQTLGMPLGLDYIPKRGRWKYGVEYDLLRREIELEVGFRLFETR